MISYLSYITLWSLRLLQKVGTRGRQWQMHTKCTCPRRKGVGGIVHRMGDVGQCPEGDYITSLLLSTWIQGNLVEPQLCQRFPFLSLAPLQRQLHIGWGFRLVSNLHNLNPTANPICNNRISLCPGECFAEHTCSFSSPSCFVSIQCLGASTVGHCKAPLGILRLNWLTQVHLQVAGNEKRLLLQSSKRLFCSFNLLLLNYYWMFLFIYHFLCSGSAL